VQDALTDLFAIRQLPSKKFVKKNDIRPFEDATSAEFFSLKNDAKFLVLGTSTKKRPHTITLMRTFDHRMLDMLELYLDSQSFRRMSRVGTFTVGLRPLMVFAGPAFESPVPNEWTLAKSLLLDFFGSDEGHQVDVAGLQYVILACADEPTAEGDNDNPASKPTLHLRVYRLRTIRSNHRLPRIEVEETGPRIDFRLGRRREAEATVLKEAMRKAKTTEEKMKKNVSTDIMGDKIGRVHLKQQDLSQLQSRKMKGLKRQRDDDLGDNALKDKEPKRTRNL
jgi:ribosome production factor 2